MYNPCPLVAAAVVEAGVFEVVVEVEVEVEVEAGRL
jgi:hypothetical protein